MIVLSDLRDMMLKVRRNWSSQVLPPPITLQTAAKSADTRDQLKKKCLCVEAGGELCLVLLR